MRIRKTDENGDMVFGHGLQDFWIDVPDAPALAVTYRLGMELGAWWLDLSAGTPWQTQVLGMRTTFTRDPVIRSRILGTDGVLNIVDYSSDLARDTRAFSVNVVINTVYSTSPIALQTSVTVAR